MLYLGIGNAGSQILDYLRTEAIKRGLNDPAWVNSRLCIGDADTNNSVMHKYKQHDKGSGECVLEQLPPFGVRKLPLDQFWSGGCGVYHILGKMLATQVHRRNGITGVLERDNFVPNQARSAVTVFISAGGGTGGGAGPEIASILAADWAPDSVRIYAVLPPIDQFSYPLAETPIEARLQITGEDSFQCASAGRFLTKYLDDCQRGNQGQVDLVIISGGYLGDPPPGLAYSRAVDHLDRFLARVVFLMDDRYSAGGRLVTPALGNATWVEEGQEMVFDPDRVGHALVRSALLPMRLDLDEPTGLSALPMERGQYEEDINKALPREGGIANEAVLGQLRAVRALRQVNNVHVQFYYHPGKHPERAAPERAFRAAEQALRKLFGRDVKLTATAVEGTDRRRLPAGCDFTLLVLLVSPLVDDVYRLVSYYVESSFRWPDGTIGDIADIIDRALTDPSATRLQLEQELERLGPEEYTPHFWGNFDHLKGKVMQALRQKEQEVRRSLLKPHKVAGALWYLRDRLWLRQTGNGLVPTPEEDAGLTED